jgi:hypothetical protein
MVAIGLVGRYCPSGSESEVGVSLGLIVVSGMIVTSAEIETSGKIVTLGMVVTSGTVVSWRMNVPSVLLRVTSTSWR